MNAIGSVLVAPILFGQTPAKTAEVGEITQAIIDSESIPTGYKGAEGAVSVNPKTGEISITKDAKGNDVGLFVEFMPVPVGANKSLAVAFSGRVFQRQGWAKYASVQLIDSTGERHILAPMCQSVHEDCTPDRVIDITGGKTVTFKMPEALKGKSIKRFEVVFIGEVKVFSGFKIGNIDLTAK